MNIPFALSHLRKRCLTAIVTAAVLALACAFTALAAPTSTAWAQVASGTFTAQVVASYTNPDDGSIADSGGQSNATLGQSMVEGVMGPEALIESDGTDEYITVRLGQAGLVSDIRVAADEAHAGTFSAETACELTSENADEKTADYRFAATDDAATFRLSMYVEPMGRDVTFFIQLADPTPGNTAGFVASALDTAKSQANVASDTASSSQSSAAASSTSESSPESAASAAASASASSTTTSSTTESTPDPLNVPLIAGIVVAAVVVIALVAYFAAIRPGRKAAQEAAAEAARREKLKRS